MRESSQLIDTGAMPWESLNPVMQRKVLNGNPDDGPHTLLLRSQPREPGPDFAQYHAVDEEFFCLEGDFTFDGGTWFRGGSYAFYPAYFVHGTGVHVRGGYVMYLRLSGVSELFKVDDPLSHEPYFVGEGEPRDRALQLVDVSASPGPGATDHAGLVVATPLHRDATSGKGSTFISSLAGAAAGSIELETSGLLEIFGVSGVFPVAGGGVLGAGSYYCDVGECPRLVLRSEQAGGLIVSHDGGLRIGSSAT